MKSIVLVSVVLVCLTFVPLSISKTVLESENPNRCLVETDEIFAKGIFTAKLEVETFNLVKFDSITFIETLDSNERCTFLFDVHLQEKHLGRAEIILVKNSWQKISRRIYKNYDSIRW